MSERKLVRKLAEVMGAVERIPKRGNNAFHKYDYATEADIVSAVRAGLAERSVMLFPSVVDRATRGTDKQTVTTLVVEFTLADGETGETMTFRAVGEGQDSGDKGCYKAMTGAVKYALLKLFLIPTGDDPELDDAPPVRAPKAHTETQRPVVSSSSDADLKIYQSILDYGKLYGKDEKQMGSFIKGATSKTSATQLKPADFEVIKKAMAVAFGPPPTP